MSLEYCKIVNVFYELGVDLMDRGIAVCELHHAHDVHAFYHLLDNSRNVIHVQGYPGMSNTADHPNEMRVFARLMDGRKRLELRKENKVSVGNEHQAVIMPFPNFQNEVYIPYEKSRLLDLLAENIPQLR